MESHPTTLKHFALTYQIRVKKFSQRVPNTTLIHKLLQANSMLVPLKDLTFLVQNMETWVIGSLINDSFQKSNIDSLVFRRIVSGDGFSLRRY